MPLSNKVGFNAGNAFWSWNECEDDEGVKSLIHYVEQHAEILREQFIGIINNVGQSFIDNKSVVEYFEVSPGFSIWWMSLLAEKSLYKSPHITDCIKVLALEKIIKESKTETIELYNIEPSIVDIISTLSKKIGVSCIIKSIFISHKVQTKRKFYHSLPHFVRGLIFLLRNIKSRISLRSTDQFEWFSGKQATYFFSYFTHLEPTVFSSGHFNSQQWGPLPDKLIDEGFKLNWMHHLLYSKIVPDNHIGKKLLLLFNTDTKQQEKHAFLDSYLSIKLIFRVLFKWFHLFWLSIRLQGVDKNFECKISDANLWPLLKEDWYTSFGGAVAMQNLFWFELFDVALRKLPRQKVGFFLFEGQGWERAFIHAWRKHEHGELIAVAHSTIRFWDIRYFDDIKRINNRFSKPHADRIAVNGPIAFNILIEAGYPIEQLVEVEALRYMNIVPSTISRNPYLHKKLKILVLGDVMPKFTSCMLHLLGKLPESILDNLDIVVKSHPGNLIVKNDYPNFFFTMTDTAISEILNEFDVVYGANPSSASLDAYLTGLPVIVDLQEGTLNMSPLRGLPGVKFVSTVSGFKVAIKTINSWSNTRYRDKYFHLERELPRWQSLINSLSNKNDII